MTSGADASNGDGRVAMIRRHVTVLTEDFESRYVNWFVAVGAGRVDDATAEQILDASSTELDSLVLAHSDGRISPVELAMARHRVRDLLDAVAAQGGVSRGQKARIRHFLVDNVPTVPIDDFGYRFTQDWFYFHEDHWAGHFADFAGRPGLRFLEIGSFEGRSATWLLQNLLTGEGSQLICVDPFTGHPEQERNFDHNMRLVGAGPRVLKLRGMSYQVLPILPAASFNFIYIDGSHAGLDVIQDAAESWRLVEPGGVIVFDDYESAVFPEWFTLACKPAIDAFLGMVSGKYELLFKDWQVAIRKTG